MISPPTDGNSHYDNVEAYERAFAAAYGSDHSVENALDASSHGRIVWSKKPKAPSATDSLVAGQPKKGSPLAKTEKPKKKRRFESSLLFRRAVLGIQLGVIVVLVVLQRMQKSALQISLKQVADEGEASAATSYKPDVQLYNYYIGVVLMMFVG